MNQLVTLLAVSTGMKVGIYILGAIIGLLAVAISIIVAMQSTKEGGLSGTIAGSGGTDSFFGKTKTMTKDRLLSRLTLVGSIVFVVLVLVLTIMVSVALG